MYCCSKLALAIFILLNVSLVTISSAVAAVVNLKNNTWEMLVIPADPANTTIASLFDSVLPSSEYGQTWSVFTYDSSTGGYLNPAIVDSLSPGQAFWIIQITGDVVELNLALSLEDTIGVPETLCSTNRTCIAVPLKASSTTPSWNLSGIPLSSPTSTDDILFVNNLPGNACSEGCTLALAAENEHLSSSLWVYDSTSGGYRDAVADLGVIAPGKGFWVATRESAADSLPALHIPTVADEANNCTWHVSPYGSDTNDGASAATALQSVSEAVEFLEAGDTLCLLPGSYPAPISISDKTGSADAPITLTSYSGNASDVVIEDGPASTKTGIEVTRSSYLHVTNLTIRHTLRGIQYNSVSYGRISGNIVSEMQQEGIRAGALINDQGLAGSPSSNISIDSNHIEDTGLRQGQNEQGYEYNEFGEGVYVGTGRFTGDATHDIQVNNNIILNTTADSIEVKPYTRNITVSNNIISGSRLKYAGAISIAIGPETFEDGNYLVTGNNVFDVTSRQYSVAGIVVGQGNAVITDNTVWDIEGGRGIRVYTTFILGSANSVRIDNNIVWNPLRAHSSIAIHDGAGGFGLNSLATVTLIGNITDDGSAASQQVTADFFQGPVTGRADNGGGPGSGFGLRP